MNLLLLTPQIPYPPRQGASMRNFYIIKGLAERHAVTLLSFQEGNQTADPSAIGELLDLVAAAEFVPVPQRATADRLRHFLTSRLPDMADRLHSARFNAKLVELLQKNSFDIVQIEGIELVRAIPLIRQHSPASKIVFDNHNAETELQRRTFLTDLRDPRRWLGAAYSAVQTRKLGRFERWACGAADAVTCVSESDRQLLNSQLSTANSPASITAIPNCLDIEAIPHPSSLIPHPFDLVFTGKMDYRPNVDAMSWFAAEVWPLVQAARPGTTLAIVGQRPHARVAALAETPGITVTGFVESVEPYLAGAGVVIMPLRMGSGTRLKFIQALAAGKAIVSTTIGAEGFPVVSGQEVVLADGAEQMAAAIVHLLANREAAAALGTAARAFAQQYDYRRVIPQFERVYQAIL